MQELISFIRRQARKGYNYSQIEEHLVNYGWRKNEIKQATNFIKGEDALKEFDEVNKKEFYSQEKPEFVHTGSSIAMMFLAFVIAAMIIGAGFFYVNSNLLTSMTVKDIGQEKEPNIEQAKEIGKETEKIIEPTNMKPYTFNLKDWDLEESGDARITKLGKDNAVLTISQLNSNNMNLLDYFESVYRIVQDLSDRDGNEILDRSDAVVNGKKAKKLLRKYVQDGKDMKLLQVYFKHKDYIYLVNYEAEKDVFDSNLNSANNLIESIEFK